MLWGTETLQRDMEESGTKFIASINPLFGSRSERVPIQIKVLTECIVSTNVFVKHFFGKK